ncbi:Wzz/FepE/Etk N-terminal domain-containing protein [soil metagenome]
MNGLYDELRIALHAIWTRRWIALAVAWGVCLLGWLVVSQIPNKYESHARVSVQMQSVLPDAVGITPGDQQKGVDQVQQTLASAVNLEKVVKGTDLASTVQNDRDVADRVSALKNSIKITEDQDNLFTISATMASSAMSDAGNARLSRQVVQKLIDIFVEGNLAGGKDENEQTLKFLDTQLAARQQQLQDADAKRADFQAKFLGTLPGTGSMDDRIAATRSAMQQVDSDLAAAQSSLNVINTQMASTPANLAGGGGGAMGPARARVAALNGQLGEMRARGFTDSHPDMVAVRAQLAQAQAAARNEPLSAGSGGSSNPMYMGLRSSQAEKQATVAALMQRKASLQGDLDTLQQRLTSDPEAANEQGDIERDYQVLKDSYSKLLADREAIRLRGQVQSQTNAIKFSVIDPPTAPSSPTSPNRPLLLTGVLLGGLAAGVGAAFVMGQLKTTFPTSGKLEKAAGMPVIGSIGEVVTRAQLADRRRKLKIFAGGLAALGVAYVGLIGVEFIQRGMIA